MIKIITEILGSNPKIGAAASGGSAGVGYMLKFTPEHMELITFIFQNLAFFLAIVVSLLTIIGWFEKRKNRKNVESDS